MSTFADTLANMSTRKIAPDKIGKYLVARIFPLVEPQIKEKCLETAAQGLRTVEMSLSGCVDYEMTELNELSLFVIRNIDENPALIKDTEKGMWKACTLELGFPNGIAKDLILAEVEKKIQYNVTFGINW